jgi:hypothetical protein
MINHLETSRIPNPTPPLLLNVSAKRSIKAKNRANQIVRKIVKERGARDGTEAVAEIVVAAAIKIESAVDPVQEIHKTFRL